MHCSTSSRTTYTERFKMTPPHTRPPHHTTHEWRSGNRQETRQADQQAGHVINPRCLPAHRANQSQLLPSHVGRSPPTASLVFVTASSGQGHLGGDLHLARHSFLALLVVELDAALVLAGAGLDEVALAHVDGLLVALLGLSVGVGPNGCVCLGVHVLEAVSVDAGGDELGEVLLVLVAILLLHLAHVLGHVLAQDAVLVLLGVVLALLAVLALLVPREPLVGVRDVQPAVHGTLERTEHAVARRGAHQADVEQSLEGPAVAIMLLLDVVVLAGHLLDALDGLVEADGLEEAASQEEAGAVGGGVVGEPHGDAVPGELGGLGAGHDAVALDGGVDDLADDPLVGDAHHKPVLGRLVLALLLRHQPTTGVVVRLALTPTTVFDLVALEVGLVLDDLDERHGCPSAWRVNEAHGSFSPPPCKE
mmetsp:Transcript_32656/g.94429  ORF Transcript_32656/g.94429 Transcript_32656/m.94429 type:complete len:421 (+) Transcript_32656:181-1443(+)